MKRSLLLVGLVSAVAVVTLAWHATSAQPIDPGLRATSLDRWVGLRCRVYFAGAITPDFGARQIRPSGLRTVNDEVAVGAEGVILSASDDAIVVAQSTGCVWVSRGMIAAIELADVAQLDRP